MEIIAGQGYGSLSMRALARASGMKLGALQYHFRTWGELLRALVGYTSAEYQRTFDSMTPENGYPSVREFAIFVLDDVADRSISSDRLWPQLWAMAFVLKNPRPQRREWLAGGGFGTGRAIKDGSFGGLEAR